MKLKQRNVNVSQFKKKHDNRHDLKPLERHVGVKITKNPTISIYEIRLVKYPMRIRFIY